MHEVHDRLFVGDDTDCTDHGAGWAVVHACKHNCHQNAVGYTGDLSKNHPHYLVLERERDLYLNMIDPDQPLFYNELFEAAMEFMARHHDAGHNVLVHCNQGRSRAPSLALLFLANVTGEIPAGSYDEARSAFEQLYPSYDPGRGIQIKLGNDWEVLREPRSASQ